MSPQALQQNDGRLMHSLAVRSMPHTYGEVASAGRWIAFNWLRYVSERITPLIVRGNARIIINAPPSHGKSQFISHWVPTWFLDGLPDRRVILAGYGNAFAEDWGRMVRNEFERNPFTMTRVRQDSSSASRWHTDRDGIMETAGVGGGITGRHFNLGIIDDPIKSSQEAWSLTYRRRIIDWFNAEFYTRQQPGASIIVNATRWHVEDLPGYLLDKHHDKWVHIRLPAIAEVNDPMGRAVGEALCPERKTLEELMAMRAGDTAWVWDSLYQQDPQGLGTGRVYEHFGPENEDASLVISDKLPLHVSFDFNISPGMHVVIGQHDPNADLFTALDEIHGPRMDVRKCMDAFEAWVKKAGGWRWPKLHVFGDASGKSQTVTTSESCYDLVVAKLRMMGMPFTLRVPDGAPGLRDSIDAFNEALRDVSGVVHYRVHPNCKRLLADLKGLKTDEDGLIDKTQQDLSHASDAERYRVHRIRPLNRVLIGPQRAGY